MATHSSVFAWRIPMDRGAWKAERMRSNLGGCPGCAMDEECYETKNLRKTGLGKYLAFALNHLYMQIAYLL